jgi:hypothetical protein
MVASVTPTIATRTLSALDLGLTPTPGLMSTQNRVAYTTTALLATGTWKSPVFSNANTRRVVGTVFSTKGGTLKFYFSDDGTHWVVTTGFNITVTANTLSKFTQVIYAAFNMIEYVNGATAQTAFRLAAYTYPQ